MEFRKKRDIVISQRTMVVIIIVTLLTVFSCRSTDVERIINPSGQAAVNIMLEDDIFDQTLSIGNKASANKSASPRVQTSTVAFNKDFDLVAELTEEVPVIVQKGGKARLQQGSKAAQITELKSKIKYKIVVYKSTGEYVVEKDYIRGQEASAGPLMLGGGNYSFVAYSINSTSALPAVKFSNAANKTLATSSIAATGSQDLMYFRKDMTISASNTNYLGVVLKHKFSQITTTIDAMPVLNIVGIINSITSEINAQHRPSATLALADGSLTRSGTVTSVPVKFPAINRAIITGTPTLINAAANNTGSYSISSFRLGNLVQTNFTPFNNLVITPGAKYNMKVTIIPTNGDVYMTAITGGTYYVPVARIGGQIWMRHNCGALEPASTGSDPDIVGTFNQGNYYQWGSSTSVSGGVYSTASNWDPNWNGNSNDPCPPSFRVPTHAEFEKLLTNVTVSEVGNWFSSPSNWSAAKILTSKQNSNVKLTLNAQGFYDTKSTSAPFYPTEIQQRGEYGYYWTSSVDPSGGVILYQFSKGNAPSPMAYYTTQIGRVVARNIRCIFTGP